MEVVLRLVLCSDTTFLLQEFLKFDNSYFTALLKWEKRDLEPGEANFIPTDVTLVLDQKLRRHVERFASDEAAFVTGAAYPIDGGKSSM